MNTKKQEARKPPAFHVFSSYSGRVLVKCMWGAVLVSVSLSMGKPGFPLADRLVGDAQELRCGLLGHPSGLWQHRQVCAVLLVSIVPSLLGCSQATGSAQKRPPFSLGEFSTERRQP